MGKTRVLVMVLALAGCAPMAAPAQMATMQRASVLAAGKSAVAVAAGLGVAGIGWPEGGAGGAVQLRKPTAAGGEVSVSGQAIAHECSGCTEDLRNVHMSFAGRVGYKWAASERTAMIAGAGLSGFPGGRAGGVDVGFIGDLWDHAYYSARLGIMVPYASGEGFDAETGDVPTTSYGSAAIGYRSGGKTGLLIETGLGAVRAGAEVGLAAYAVIGIDVEY